MDEILVRIRRTLEAHGISNYQLKRTRKHRRMVISHAGREIRITLPSTPSDWRAARNCAADLRRPCGGAAS